MRDPEIERACPTVKGALFIPEMEFDRLRAEAGCGRFELWLMPPRVYIDVSI